MGTIRIPDTIHEIIKKFAQKDSISMGKIIEKQFQGELDSTRKNEDKAPVENTPPEPTKPINQASEPIENKDSKAQPKEGTQEPTLINQPTKAIENKKIAEDIKSQEKKEKIGRAKEQPIPEKKEKIMQEQDLQEVNRIVNSLREGIDTKFANQENAYEKAIANLAEKIIKASPKTETKGKVTPSLTAQDVEGMLDKRDTRRAEAEAERAKQEKISLQRLEEEKVRKQDREAIGKVKEEVKALPKIHCSSDGVCFVDPKMRDEHEKQLEERKKQIKEKQEKKDKGFIEIMPLAPIDAARRKAISEEEEAKRDSNFLGIVKKSGGSAVDAWRMVLNHPEDYARVKEHVLSDLKREDVDNCYLTKDGRLVCQNLKESGVDIRVQDKESGKWHSIADEQEKKKPEF